MSYVTSFERLSREEGLQQGLQRGLQQGRKEERYEMAKNLLAEGLSLDLVKKVTKLPDLDLAELEKV
jgi:recombination-promoting nuclease RpnB